MAVASLAPSSLMNRTGRQRNLGGGSRGRQSNVIKLSFHNSRLSRKVKQKTKYDILQFKKEKEVIGRYSSDVII